MCARGQRRRSPHPVPLVLRCADGHGAVLAVDQPELQRGLQLLQPERHTRNGLGRPCQCVSFSESEPEVTVCTSCFFLRCWTVSYVSATTVACSIAYGMSALNRRLIVTSPAVKKALKTVRVFAAVGKHRVACFSRPPPSSQAIPFTAVASAGAFNAGAMRFQDVTCVIGGGDGHGGCAVTPSFLPPPQQQRRPTVRRPRKHVRHVETRRSPVPAASDVDARGVARPQCVPAAPPAVSSTSRPCVTCCVVVRSFAPAAVPHGFGDEGGFRAGVCSQQVGQAGC